MKFGVSTYSFSGYVGNGKMTQKEVIAKAKGMGFDVLEFSDLVLPDGIDIKDYAKELREECDRVGIEVGNYTIGADLLNGCGGDIDKEIDRLINTQVEVANILRSPGMRHDVTGGFCKEIKTKRGFEDALTQLVKGCTAVTEAAKKYGIKTMMENHGFFCQDSDRVERLINAVGNENFGLLLDIGNFMCVGESPEKAVGKLAPYAIHVHVKDFHFKSGNADNPGDGWFRTRSGNYLRGAILGHGEVPVKQCLSIIKAAGYDGCVSLEFEGMEDSLIGIEKGYANLKRFIEEA